MRPMMWIAMAVVAWLLVACGGSSGGGSPSPSVAATVTPTQAPTATSPEPTEAATSNRPVADMNPPGVREFQVGPDGRYFVAERGDGCAWSEVYRGTITVGGENINEVILDTDCSADFNFVLWPDKGQVRVQAP